jgi:hypothetical protein
MCALGLPGLRRREHLLDLRSLGAAPVGQFTRRALSHVQVAGQFVPCRSLCGCAPTFARPQPFFFFFANQVRLPLINAVRGCAA